MGKTQRGPVLRKALKCVVKGLAKDDTLGLQWQGTFLKEYVQLNLEGKGRGRCQSRRGGREELGPGEDPSVHGGLG